MRTRMTNLTCNTPMNECRANMLRLLQPGLRGRKNFRSGRVGLGLPFLRACTLSRRLREMILNGSSDVKVNARGLREEGHNTEM
jgi:hypothetical protein